MTTTLTTVGDWTLLRDSADQIVFFGEVGGFVPSLPVLVRRIEDGEDPRPRLVFVTVADAQALIEAALPPLTLRGGPTVYAPGPAPPGVRWVIPSAPDPDAEAAPVEIKTDPVRCPTCGRAASVSLPALIDREEAVCEACLRHVLSGDITPDHERAAAALRAGRIKLPEDVWRKACAAAAAAAQRVLDGEE